MKKLIAAAAFVFLAACAAWSQDVPTFELFGGYSYLRVNPTGSSGVDTSGWEASGNYNFNRTWGLKADFSGHYCCGGDRLHTFLGGPQLSYRSDRFTVFGHALFGGANAGGGGTSVNSAAWVFGGGFDWKFGDRVAWRVAQTDYLGTHFLGNTQSNFRASTGLVFRFGKK